MKARRAQKVKPFTKSQQQFVESTNELAYKRGLDAGRIAAQEQNRADINERREVAHIAALEAITKIANALGQSIQAVADAMRSDRGQL
jgi:hypothetical protein